MKQNKTNHPAIIGLSEQESQEYQQLRRRLFKPGENLAKADLTDPATIRYCDLSAIYLENRHHFAQFICNPIRHN